MIGEADSIGELHWLLGIIQNVDVGLVVIDRDCNVRLWNGFMENHSGQHPSAVNGKPIFEMFPDVPVDWLQSKIDSVFLLKNSAFSTWQQRKNIINFKSYRPITGKSESMFQDVTFLPLSAINGEINHVCIIIYDVTEMAVDEIALAQMGRTDALTKLLNRGAWEEQLNAEYSRVQRSGMTSAMLMFDIDHFKLVNDTYGHQAGDEVIRAVSELVRETKRESDIAGRYGGEEFAVILVDTDEEGALIYAERLREAIAATTVTHNHHNIQFTVSIGVAESPHLGTPSKEWIESADNALYYAKEHGRNQTTLYSSISLDD
ncbi:MAG: GGDEF domain-containing protein [Gammaproteobacteria bacterium]|nr:GGDEF domain-containing protein [Gammaproteobacteria bacterium]